MTTLVLRNSTNRSPLRHSFLLVSLVLGLSCFALLPAAKAVTPAPDGGSPGNNRAERAATLADERANAHSKKRCWHYVKEALLASGVINSYPETACAKEAGDELVRNHGFRLLSIRDPYAAPVGAVLVYGASRAAGHVEIRTKDGFVSDFRSKTPSPRQLIGVYAKS